jgi:hypothetical protein
MNVWRLIVSPLGLSLGISLAGLAHSAENLPREALGDTPPFVSLLVPPADSLVRELLAIEVQFVRPCKAWMRPIFSSMEWAR